MCSPIVSATAEDAESIVNALIASLSAVDEMLDFAIVTLVTSPAAIDALKLEL